MSIKKVYIIFATLFVTQFCYAQLCKPNEKIVFAFQLKNQKWISVCKEKKEYYIVYRYGTKTKIELQYPATLDSTSWQQFTFKGYNRGGGKRNAALHYAFLSFNNNNINYEVYEIWNSDDDKEKCGVFVNNTTKTIDMRGILKSRKGELLSLRNNDKIKPEEEN